MAVVACTKAEAIAAVEAAAFETDDDPPRRIVHSMTGPPVMLGCDMDVESVIAHIESADDSDPEHPQIGWVDDSIVAHELVAINGDNRVLWFDVKAPPGTFEPPAPAMVRLPDLTITEARLLARLLELAPIEVSMSKATISDSAAAELMATAQSLRTATLEAITTAERTGTADEETS